MHKGSGGMGSTKHGKSGRAPKSPRYRHATEMALRKEEATKKKPEPLPHSTVKDVFKGK